MSDQTLTARPGPTDRTVRTADGKVIPVPDGWELLPPGDPGVTRRVKAAGPSWTVQEQRGRKVFSRGVWAPAATIAAVRAELEVERADPAYARKLAAGAKRREAAQAEYVEDFTAAVRDYLRFDARYADLAGRFAVAVAAHATPVGSGTVARTKRIPVERRAEAAVIAWLRHQTTAYDDMHVARVKGARREVRRKLAAGSKALLDRYRRGEPVPPTGCVLERGLAKAARAG
ncbi:DUF2293 domain-containing protein [Urbifossiella limnaea]|uniref:DUF2293 domain-containing protein n=1 Tax=Urbifossiella limnaea TaxID=2528023 RepID=A0A517XT84_9BACT|nr:DUF2293 domain-containing protein [Urbifossiella limnaea]QDU20702.1 hypothetical protein ETAA1_26590 [Urbifossiella limnaea]